MKLSLIIPVYNVEKYVEKCLLSCLAQDISLDDYEIIVVNDGTPDGSMAIVERIAKGYDNIHVINQENQGLSMARNNGFAIAKGEYVWFVDSDDWIEANCLSSLFGYMRDEVDEIVIGAKRVSADGEDVLYNLNLYPHFHEKVLDGKESWRMGVNQVSTAQLTIYRSEFLRENALSFIQGIYHEDFEFCIKASYLSKRTLYLNEPIYYFRETPGSITHCVNPKKSYDYIVIAKSLRRFCSTYIAEPDIATKMHYYISMAINNGLNNICNSSVEECSKYEKCLKENRVIFESLFKSGKAKYILEGILFKLSDKYVKVYNGMKNFA